MTVVDGLLHTVYFPLSKSLTINQIFAYEGVYSGSLKTFSLQTNVIRQAIVTNAPTRSVNTNEADGDKVFNTLTATGQPQLAVTTLVRRAENVDNDTLSTGVSANEKTISTKLASLLGTSASAIGAVAPSNVLESCYDGAKNNEETDVDCGGGTCSQCPPMKQCNKNLDCQSNLCIASLCADTSSSDSSRTTSNIALMVLMSVVTILATYMYVNQEQH